MQECRHNGGGETAEDSVTF